MEDWTNYCWEGAVGKFIGTKSYDNHERDFVGILGRFYAQTPNRSPFGNKERNFVPQDVLVKKT